MTRKGVQVHARHLPGCIPGDLLPLLGRERQSGKQTKIHLRHVPFAALEALEVADDFRQLGFIDPLANQPGIQGFTRCILRTRMHHLHDIGERRLLSYRRIQQLTVTRVLQPTLHQTLVSRPARLVERIRLRQKPPTACGEELHVGHSPPSFPHSIERIISFTKLMA